MFTGIITGVGRITSSQALGNSPDHGRRLTIAAPRGYLADVGLGDSIALNGACMTVTSFDASTDCFTIDISAESLSKTAGLGGTEGSLGSTGFAGSDDLGRGDDPSSSDGFGAINLEKALRAGDRLGGHIVSGHVDGVGVVTQFEQIGESWLLRILCPAFLSKFLATKGSAVINGVSLTTNTVKDTESGCEISINLIPHTLIHTALGQLKKGHLVNLEIDLIARYVERMLAHSSVNTDDQ